MIKNQDIIINNIVNNPKNRTIDVVKKTLIVCIVFYFVVNLFQNSQIVCLGVSKGVHICVDIIVPSLFPFMVICNFVSFCDMVNLISGLIRPVTKYIFKLPVNVGYLIFLSFIGGYPMGAKVISDALGRNEISLNLANRLLCFCVNAGPAFVITAVGLMMCGSRKKGVYLLLAHVLSSVIVGFLTRFVFKTEKTELTQNVESNTIKKINHLNYPEAFVKAVTDGFYSILNISSFVVIFSVITEIIKNNFLGNTFADLILCFLEITVGMKNVIEKSGTISLLLCEFLVSFSGVSVICQVFYFIKNYAINKRKFLLFRVIHGLISLIIIYLINFFVEDLRDIKYVSMNFYNKQMEIFELSSGISLMILGLACCFIVFSCEDFDILSGFKKAM